MYPQFDCSVGGMSTAGAFRNDAAATPFIGLGLRLDEGAYVNVCKMRIAVWALSSLLYC